MEPAICKRLHQRKKPFFFLFHHQYYHHIKNQYGQKKIRSQKINGFHKHFRIGKLQDISLQRQKCLCCRPCIADRKRIPALKNRNAACMIRPLLNLLQIIRIILNLLQLLIQFLKQKIRILHHSAVPTCSFITAFNKICLPVPPQRPDMSISLPINLRPNHRVPRIRTNQSHIQSKQKQPAQHKPPPGINFI